jgi:hypothetical protein
MTAPETLQGLFHVFLAATGGAPGPMEVALGATLLVSVVLVSIVGVDAALTRGDRRRAARRKA